MEKKQEQKKKKKKKSNLNQLTLAGFVKNVFIMAMKK